MSSGCKKSQSENGLDTTQRGVGNGSLLGYKIEVDNGVITRKEPIPVLLFWSPVMT